ncbi:PH domain-containing protein [Corynebacterium accolens]|uniref:PH domain-containing protein n=1 Tax=Corynebacterium accolens TaxID=38284 RepID=A0AAP4BYE9_9CORY|nr:PH domain-containing protein [Corynebacterium accolens]MDK4310831.1 PH domain-containing protein [Corynebacterium accolens]MDK4332014.1 PH domain-containing protein [Corynebacterium accolens]MDK4335500.1 PH domain-containing protein [Corynebacterium accolens]
MSEEMNPVSPRLINVRYIRHLGWTSIFAAAAAAAGYWWTTWFYWAAGLFAVLFFWLIWLIPAQVRRMGWCETDDELLITRGKLWHTFTVVPYGRIQFVDVTAGPLERVFGLKELQLHTASATTDATIKGLEAPLADALRTRLADHARERMSGL